MRSDIKPKHLKIITGSREPVIEAVELPALDDVPPAPDWLPNAHAAKEWARVAPILVANRLLASADLAAFGHYCAVHGKLVQLWTAGESPTGHMLAQFSSLASSFGLAPAWRAKVKPIGDKDAANPFEKHKHPAA